MSIVLNTVELKKRKQTVKKLIRPILSKPAYKTIVPQEFVDQSQKAYHIYISSESKYIQDVNRLTCLKTVKDPFYFTYEEKWIEEENNSTYKLLFSYFHIYRSIHKSAAEDFLFLHVEPETRTGNSINDYKIIPHLHVRCAIEPIPKSHLALFLYTPENFLCDVDSFEKSFVKCIELLKSQIFDLV